VEVWILPGSFVESNCWRQVVYNVQVVLCCSSTEMKFIGVPQQNKSQACHLISPNFGCTSTEFWFLLLVLARKQRSHSTSIRTKHWYWVCGCFFLHIMKFVVVRGRNESQVRHLVIYQFWSYFRRSFFLLLVLARKQRFHSSSARTKYYTVVLCAWSRNLVIACRGWLLVDLLALKQSHLWLQRRNLSLNPLNQ
jgi:hypothetical protein